jgi:hypothetical protein
VSHICALRLRVGQVSCRIFPTENRQWTTENLLGFRSSEGVQQTIALLLQIFDNGAEVNSLIGESAIFRDFGLVHHFESIALKQFEAPPAVECHHLRVDLFDAMVVQVAQVGFEKLTADLDRLCRREKVDVKVPNGSGSAGDFAPGLRNQPMNVLPGFRPVAEVAAANFCGVGEILKEAVELMPQGVTRPEEIAEESIALGDNERRVRLVLEIIVGEKIREQLSILEYRIDRVSQEASFAAERTDRIPIRCAIFTDLKVLKLEHSGFHAVFAILRLKRDCRCRRLHSEKRIARNIFDASSATAGQARIVS